MKLVDDRLVRGKLRVAPSRERELKRNYSLPILRQLGVAPSRERELKPVFRQADPGRAVVAPSRERELKPRPVGSRRRQTPRRSLTGA